MSSKSTLFDLMAAFMGARTEFVITHQRHGAILVEFRGSGGLSEVLLCYRAGESVL